MDILKLTLDPEFFSYLPRHSGEEHDRLEAQLLKEGIADRIRVWKHDGKVIVVDGMERVLIARKHDLPVEVLEMEFADRAAVKLWMSMNQIARRNVTKAQFDYHLGEIYNATKGSHGGDRKSDEEEPRGDAAQKVAEETNTSKAKVRRAGKFAEAVDAAAAKAPEVREALNAGKKIAPAKLREIAEAETKAEAAKLAKAAVGGEDEEKQEEEPDAEAPAKEIKDGNGKPVTDHRFHAVFLDMREFERLSREMRKIQTAMTALAKAYGGANLRVDTVVASSFKMILAELKQKKPVCICPKCRGEREVQKGRDGPRIECGDCMGLGWLDVMRDDHRKKAQEEGKK